MRLAIPTMNANPSQAPASTCINSMSSTVTAVVLTPPEVRLKTENADVAKIIAESRKLRLGLPISHEPRYPIGQMKLMD